MNTKSLHAENPEAANPTHFGDALALKTAWTPARAGGASMRMQQLQEVSPGRFEFRATRAALMVCGFIGLGAVTGSIGLGIASQVTPGVDPRIFLVAGAVNLLISLGFAYWYYLRLCAPRVFDTRRGLYWSGHREPPQQTVADGKTVYRLGDIHAIQLLGELCRAKNSRYMSYELNLVRRDGQRVNVTDSGDLAALRQDAATLAARLKCKLWDATQG